MSSQRSTTGVLARLRRFYWQRLRRYSYEVCDRCGRPVAARAFGFRRDADGVLTPRTYWFADNPVWNAVIGSEAGIRCPSCFTDEAERAGLMVGWRCGMVGEIEPNSENVSMDDDRPTIPVEDLLTRDDLLDAIQGARLALADRLEWTERQHPGGAWHVTAELPGFPVFGHDGHLLSTDVEECRFLAFVRLLSCIADSELNPQAD